MTVLASRGAYTCARCEVRQSLLGHGGRRARLLAPATVQRRCESSDAQEPVERNPVNNRSEHEERPLRDYVYKRLLLNPEEAGRRGRRHFESSEQLKIKSLDKESEVIILRELPEYLKRHRRQRPRQEQATSSPEAVSSAIDLRQSLSEVTPPTSEEIVAALEQHRPTEQLLSRAAYNRLKADIAKSFNKPQVQLYLQEQLPRKKAAIKANPIARKDSVAAQPINSLEVSAWKAKSSKASPIQVPELEIRRDRLQSAAKHVMIDGILKLVWGLQVEEVSEGLGKVEIKMTPRQWGLLNTRDDIGLFNALRSKRFFQRTSFDRDPKRERLVIRGPRFEAEQVAKLFETAFAEAASFDIDLGPLRRYESGVAKIDITGHFFAAKLQEIMFMTKTFISLNKETSTLEVAAFRKANLEEAIRLVVMLFERPRNQVWVTLPLPATDLLAWEPVHTSKLLPSYAQTGAYERRVLKHMRHRAHSLRLQKEWKDVRDIRTYVDEIEHSLGTIRSILPTRNARVAEGEVEDPYWGRRTLRTPWKARFGSLLAERYRDGMPVTSGTDAFDEAGLQAGSDAKTESSSSQFAAKIPAMTSVMSYFQRIDSNLLGDRTAIEPRLVAKLIPSPFAFSEALHGPSLPAIDIEFRISRIPQTLWEDQGDAQQIADIGTSPDNDRHSWRMNDYFSLKLASIQATMKDVRVNAPMPHRPVDLQLVSQSIISADLDKIMEHPGVKDFVEAIATSMQQQGTELRAPQSVDIPLTDKMKLRAIKSGSDVKEQTAFPYLFAGFEHHQDRRIDPGPKTSSKLTDGDGAWVVSDIEGGVSGGRRLELTSQAQHPLHASGAMRLRREFIAGACAMVELIQFLVSKEMPGVYTGPRSSRRQHFAEVNHSTDKDLAEDESSVKSIADRKKDEVALKSGGLTEAEEPPAEQVDGTATRD